MTAVSTGLAHRLYLAELEVVNTSRDMEAAQRRHAMLTRSFIGLSPLREDLDDKLGNGTGTAADVVAFHTQVVLRSDAVAAARNRNTAAIEARNAIADQVYAQVRAERDAAASE